MCACVPRSSVYVRECPVGVATSGRGEKVLVSGSLRARRRGEKLLGPPTASFAVSLRVASKRLDSSHQDFISL